MFLGVVFIHFLFVAAFVQCLKRTGSTSRIITKIL
jgi:hypothetical protein